MAVLVTGAAGFIGYHVSAALLARGEEVVGCDNLTPYYDVSLKRARLADLADRPGWSFVELDIADAGALDRIGGDMDVDRVVHLAAQAGVRYSIENPAAYVHSNLDGHFTILEFCRRLRSVQHLVYASSSSVYGGNTQLPFKEDDRVDHPVSLYAATKRADELMSHTYAHLYGLAQTGLRFFTVYGPWGRPDMAYWSFTEAILEGRPIRLFNHGAMRRDFTYVDDVVAGVLAALDRPPGEDGALPHLILNLGNNRPVELGAFVDCLEKVLERTAIREPAPMQPGDVEETAADLTRAREWIGFQPRTSIEEGLQRFAEWYLDYQSRRAV